MLPESNCAEFDASFVVVAVCVYTSVFFHSMVSPTLTVRSAGSKPKFLMVMVCVVGEDDALVCANAAPESAAVMRRAALIFRMSMLPTFRPGTTAHAARAPSVLGTAGQRFRVQTLGLHSERWGCGCSWSRR